MKVMLVNPPNAGKSIPEEKYGIKAIKQLFRGEPLGLEELAANLEEHDVRIVDMKVCEQDFTSELEAFRPDVIGFSSVTCEAQTVSRLAKQAKLHHDVTTIVGGVHATYQPEWFNREEFDYIVIGLGKQSFRELLDGFGDVPGVAKTNPGESLRYTPRAFSMDDLVQEKPPRYDLVEKYRKQYVVERVNLPVGFVGTSVGCPYACSFCAIPRMTGGQYFSREPEYVLRDIELLSEIPVIRLVDANTFGDPDQALSIARMIQERGIKKTFALDIRADAIVEKEDVLREWKKAGLGFAVVGFEEICDDKLNSFNKRYSSQIIPKAVEILHELDIKILGDFIVSPDYTEADFDRLEQYITDQAIELPVFTILTPMPGTPLYQSMKDRVLIHDLDYYTYMNAVVETRLPEDVFYLRFSELYKRFHERKR